MLWHIAAHPPVPLSVFPARGKLGPQPLDLRLQRTNQIGHCVAVARGDALADHHLRQHILVGPQPFDLCGGL
jgi:hypothetical protein